MSDFGLVPKYTEADFETLVTRLKSILSKTATFKDYDFEGANITLLMELLSYVGDLNTYYTNRLAQNIHLETANIYEVVHSLTRQQGYVPSGLVSSEVTLTVRVRRRNDDQTIGYFEQGSQLYIPKWFKINTGLSDDDGNSIYYCLPEDFIYDVTDTNLRTDYDEELETTYEYVEFDIVMKQGVPLQEPLTYTGEDVISNQIVLPLVDYDMGVYPYEDTLDSLLVTVGSEETAWIRISDFFDDISGLSGDEENVYVLYYDKYKRTVISFSSNRNVPTDDEVIKIYPIKTLGLNGKVAKLVFGDSNKPVVDTILGVDDVAFLSNISTAEPTVIPEDRYTVVNYNASVGGSNAQVLSELKEAGQSYSHSQLRNVTKKDYKGNLESRGDITVANVWGEHEQNYDDVNSIYYNRAYVALIPTEWDTGVSGNINLVDVDVSDDFSGNLTTTLKTLEYPIETYDTDVETFGDKSFAKTGLDTLIDGTYDNVVTVTDGLGVGCTVQVVVLNGNAEITAVSEGGSGYLVGDYLWVTGDMVEWVGGDTGGVTVKVGAWVETVGSSVYNPLWQSQILEYLEPRKMLGIWEEFVLPELIYFRFDIGLRVNRTYSFVKVKEVVKNKLIYYFQNSNRSFGETIDFRDVYNYIMDTNNVSSTDNFDMIRGISSLVIRDILIYRDPSTLETIDTESRCVYFGGTWDETCSIVPDEMYIYPENVAGYFPHYENTGYGKNTIDTTYNTLQPIALGYNQFPQLASDFCTFTNEG